MNSFAKVSAVAALVLGVVLVYPAAAVDVAYTVYAWGPQQYPGPVTPPADCPHMLDGFGYPGDIVDIQPYTGTLLLVPGTYVQKINTLQWTVNYTYAGTPDDCDAWSDLFFDLSVPRAMTIDTVNGTLSQTGLLEVTWFNDYISFDAGSTTTFNLLGYTVYVTPLAFPRTEAVFEMRNWPPWVQPPYDIMAEFVVMEAASPVEPGSWSTIKSLYR